MRHIFDKITHIILNYYRKIKKFISQIKKIVKSLNQYLVGKSLEVI